MRHFLSSIKTTWISSMLLGSYYRVLLQRAGWIMVLGCDLPQRSGKLLCPGEGKGLFQDPECRKHRVGVDQTLSQGIFGNQCLFWPGSSWIQLKGPQRSHHRTVSPPQIKLRVQKKRSYIYKQLIFNNSAKAVFGGYGALGVRAESHSFTSFIRLHFLLECQLHEGKDFSTHSFPGAQYNVQHKQALNRCFLKPNP